MASKNTHHRTRCPGPPFSGLRKTVMILHWKKSNVRKTCYYHNSPGSYMYNNKIAYKTGISQTLKYNSFQVSQNKASKWICDLFLVFFMFKKIFLFLTMGKPKKCNIIFRSKAPLQLTLSICSSVCSSVCLYTVSCSIHDNSLYYS